MDAPANRDKHFGRIRMFRLPGPRPAEAGHACIIPRIPAVASGYIRGEALAPLTLLRMITALPAQSREAWQRKCESDRGSLGARCFSAGTVASAITRNTPSLARIHHSPGPARPCASVSRTSASELGLPRAGNGAPPPYQPERRPASVGRERGRSRSLCWCPRASSDSGHDPHRLLVCVMSGRVGAQKLPKACFIYRRVDSYRLTCLCDLSVALDSRGAVRNGGGCLGTPVFSGVTGGWER
jgi:hypothetical protein